jgi:hypothetical protein
VSLAEEKNEGISPGGCWKPAVKISVLDLFRSRRVLVRASAGVDLDPGVGSSDRSWLRARGAGMVIMPVEFRAIGPAFSPLNAVTTCNTSTWLVLI